MLPTVQTVGVVLGLWGTLMVSWDAAREVRNAIWGSLRAVGGWIRRLGRKPKAQLAEPPPPAVGSVEGSFTYTVEAIGWPDGDLAAQVQALRAWLERLDKVHGGDHSALEARLRVLEGRVADDAARHDAAFRMLRAEAEQQRQMATRINARGLPLIGASILLSGLPDGWVSEPGVGLPLLLVAAVVAAAVIVIDVRSRRSGLPSARP